MNKSRYNVIGVMSGTSLDGIDLIYASFNLTNNRTYKIHYAETINYPEAWLTQLKYLTDLSLSDLQQFDIEYTAFLAGVISNFIVKNNIETIDAVCSHGHTALHKPEENLTLQIGNKPNLAELLKQNVVCDFRVQDVSLGGQGAPLVPVGDKLLFNEYDACVNLGGFSNISKDYRNKRIAFDISPVNIVLNYYTSKKGMAYDDGGKIAQSGQLHKKLFKALNDLEFYKKEYPKSLGLEWVKSEVFPLIDKFQIKTEDILSTVVEHIAFQISLQLEDCKTVLFTGGGVYNLFLMNRIKHYSSSKLVIPNQSLIEYKEALIFGLLGVLKLRNEVNCLASVTGASTNHSSGKIYYFRS